MSLNCWTHTPRFCGKHLGHKNIRNTWVYTHLVSFESDEWVCRVAKTVEDARDVVRVWNAVECLLCGLGFLR